MSAARRINTTVQADGKIEVRAPDLPLGQPVEVIIRLTNGQVAAAPKRSIVDILAQCPGGLRFKTPEDVVWRPAPRGDRPQAVDTGAPRNARERSKPCSRCPDGRELS